MVEESSCGGSGGGYGSGSGSPPLSHERAKQPALHGSLDGAGRAPQCEQVGPEGGRRTHAVLVRLLLARLERSSVLPASSLCNACRRRLGFWHWP